MPGLQVDLDRAVGDLDGVEPELFAALQVLVVRPLPDGNFQEGPARADPDVVVFDQLDFFHEDVDVDESAGAEGQLDKVDAVGRGVQEVLGGADAQPLVDDHGEAFFAGLHGAPGNGHFEHAIKRFHSHFTIPPCSFLLRP